jgi:hypothetical protein
VTDLFSSGIMRRPFFQLTTRGTDVTPNEVDEPDGLSRGTLSDSTAPSTGRVSIQYYPAWVSNYQAGASTPWSGNPGTVCMEGSALCP